jgi:hypothetical protein
MKYVWKCDRGHALRKNGAERRDYRGEPRWFLFCARCNEVKPISRERAGSHGKKQPAEQS